MKWASIGLVVWAIVGVVFGGVLLAQHLVALPTPSSKDARLRAAIATLTKARAQWRAVHVMYRTCPCSLRTISHLASGARPADLHEVVVIVDDEGRAGPEDSLLRSSGFEVEVVTPEVLHRRFHIEAAPLLVIARPDGELAYVGGYTRRKQGPAFEDVAIIAELREARDTVALPVFGCATSARLSTAMDPIGLRRW